MRLSRLTIVIGLLIVISASFMSQVFDLLYDNIGEQKTAIIMGSCFILIFLFILWRITQLPVALRRKILFFVILAIGLYFSWRIKILVERIHILEYGLLGYLATRDLLTETFSFKAIIFIILTIAVFAFLDEGFQYILPYRYWDLRDIVFNLSGGLWGAALFLIRKQAQNQPITKNNLNV